MKKWFVLLICGAIFNAIVYGVGLYYAILLRSYYPGTPVVWPMVTFGVWCTLSGYWTGLLPTVYKRGDHDKNQQQAPDRD